MYVYKEKENPPDVPGPEMAELEKVDGEIADLTARVLALKVKQKQLMARPKIILQALQALPALPALPVLPVLILFDLETTGLGKTCLIRICEVGMVNYGTGQTFQRFVNPQQSVPQGATQIHGLRDEFLAQQQTWRDVGQQFNDALQSYAAASPHRPLVVGGFNSKRYDARILTFEHHRFAHKFPPNIFFVDFKEVLAKLITLRTHKKGLAQYHEAAVGKSIKGAHTAVADAKAIANILDTIEDKALLYHTIDDKMEPAECVMKRCFR